MTKGMVKNIIFMKSDVVLDIKCVRPETALEIAKEVLNTKENCKIIDFKDDGYYVACQRQYFGELNLKKYREYNILIEER